MKNNCDIDTKLLSEYVERGMNQAFDEIVRRYRRLVYSTALRELRDRTAADDVTQSVFILLSNKAREMVQDVSLPRWLFHTSRLLSANHRRKEVRARKLIDEIGRSCLPPARSMVGPLINEALASLDPGSLDLVMRRYYDQFAFGEIGLQLGISEDAARKRVDRAVDKLRRLLADAGFERTTTETKGVVRTMLTETDAMREIDEAYNRLDEVYMTQDIEAIAALLEELYTDDFVIVNLDGSRRPGTRDEIRYGIAKGINSRPPEKSRVHEIKLINLENRTAVVVVDLKVVFEVDPPQGYHFTAENRWTKIDGSWRIAYSKSLSMVPYV